MIPSLSLTCVEKERSGQEEARSCSGMVVRAALEAGVKM